MLNLETLSRVDLTHRVKYLQLLTEQFWRRFYHEYTVALRERMLYDKSKRSEAKLNVGDVVIIKDDRHLPRRNLILLDEIKLYEVQFSTLFRIMDKGRAYQDLFRDLLH